MIKEIRAQSNQIGKTGEHLYFKGKRRDGTEIYSLFYKTRKEVLLKELYGLKRNFSTIYIISYRSLKTFIAFEGGQLLNI